MTVLAIRSHKRYAMREAVSLRGECGVSTCGLLIEISADGARISNLGPAAFVAGDNVQISVFESRRLAGTVRWAHDGLAGIRFERRLQVPELSHLIAVSRGGAEGEQRRYGT